MSDFILSLMNLNVTINNIDFNSLKSSLEQLLTFGYNLFEFTANTVFSIISDIYHIAMRLNGLADLVIS